VSEQQLSVHLRNKGEMSVCENLQYRGFRRVKKEEEPIISFIWNGATVRVYTQVVKFAGTTIQRHLLPTNLRKGSTSGRGRQPPRSQPPPYSTFPTERRKCRTAALWR
ncbi:hypothetical protein ACFGT3_000752, partial [Citrobacter freundii]